MRRNVEMREDVSAVEIIEFRRRKKGISENELILSRNYLVGNRIKDA